MKFSIRDTLWLTTVVGLVIALIYTKRPQGPPPQPPVGRYQMMSDPKSGYVFLLDSATGQTWKYYSGSWTDDRPSVPAPRQP
jgi:hypothetical protein